MISIFTTLYFLNGPEGPFSPAGGLFAHMMGLLVHYFGE